MVYLKQCLQHAARKRDLPRIILLGPPEFDMLSLAKLLQKKIGVKPVTLRELHGVSPETPIESTSGEVIARNFKTMLKTSTIDHSGWALVGNYTIHNPLCAFYFEVKKIIYFFVD